MAGKGITRRQFLKKTAILSGAASASLVPGMAGRKWGVPFLKNPAISRRAIVLGMDGMDPNLIRRYVEQGELPTFKRFLEHGHFGALQTTMPPQSPVAWGSFITGTNPGGNGIFDFVHREAATFTPYMSTSRSFDAKSKFDIGSWSVPLDSGKVELMRRGKPFWSVLEENDIPATVFQIPSNFPVTPGSKSNEISGMGTPDLLGTYGTSTYFTDTFVAGSDKFTGGRVVRVRPLNHVIKTVLSGPQNSFRVEKQSAEIPLVIHRDANEQVIRISIQDQEIFLKQGEFSDWVPLKFEMVPWLASAKGMVRFYAKEVHPNFKLYASPINVDPLDPALPICSPVGYSAEVAQAIGRFYTQGFPADTKALTNGVFSNEEFLAQAKLVIEENMKAFDYHFNRFDEGMFFFYFSSVDQNSHMLWRLMDEKHPLYEPNASEAVKKGVLYFYKKMDEVLKQALSKVDNYTTLIALSDHGFAPFYREFNLSTWLVQQGYTVLTDPKKMEEGEFYQYVDWKKTKAYALGLNGIYFNLQGREKNGSISAVEGDGIKQEIMAKLATVKDPQNGQSVVTRAYDSKALYHGPYMELAPDIVVGYQSGYRVSDEAVLGKFPRDIVRDRTDPWAADHCLDPAVVPGMMLTNRKCTAASPGLWDMGPSILRCFGLDPLPEMEGKAVLEA